MQPGGDPVFGNHGRRQDGRPTGAEGNEDAASEASEWEARDQAERAWEREVEAVRLGEESVFGGRVRWRGSFSGFPTVFL